MYDPFLPGPFSVAERSMQAFDTARDRTFPCDVWHPSEPAGICPIVLLSHSSGGSGRRAYTFLTNHLASHGYIVAGLNHSELVAPEFAHREGETPAQRTARAEAFMKKKTAEEKQSILDAIPRAFPNIAESVRAFVLIQRYSGLRLVEVVTLRTDAVREDSLMIMSQEKNEQPVFVPLPPVVIDLIGKLHPKSPDYFFWTGTSTIKTAVNDWSEKMRQLYVEAGIEGKRTHEWRDTLAIEVLEGGGSLEDVQLLLGHKSRKTTEKYYVALTKKRMEKAIDARRRTWDADVISVPAARS